MSNINKKIDQEIKQAKAEYNEGQIARKYGKGNRLAMKAITDNQIRIIKRLQALEQERNPRVIWN
jgi:hypothetical protein